MSKFINPLYEFLRADGFIPDFKILNHALGIHESILYAELMSKRAYFADRDELTEDGCFFNTVFDIQDSTGLTEKMQRSAIKNLKTAGLIEVELREMPAKRFFRIIDDLDVLERLVLIGQERRLKLKQNHCSAKRAEHDPPNRSANNINNVEKGIKPEQVQIMRAAFKVNNTFGRKPRKEQHG